MSAMPEVNSMRGGMVGSRAKTMTAMKFMARNQLRTRGHELRRLLKAKMSVAKITGRWTSWYSQTNAPMIQSTELTRAWIQGSTQMPTAFSRFMKNMPLSCATASRPCT